MLIGIDPSLSNTAVCWSAGAGHAVRCFGSEPCPPDVRSRLTRFEHLVADIVAHLDTLGPIQGVFLENYAFGAKMGREQAGEFGGLLRWHLLDLCGSPAMPIVEVAPHALKKFATGKGAGEKDMVAAHLTNRYGVLLRNNDEYDAYALWQIGRCYLGHTEPENEAQRDVLDKLRAGPQKKPRKAKKAKHPVEQGQDEPMPF